MVLRDKRGLYVSISTLLGQFSRPPQEDVVYGTTLLLFNAQRGAGERKKLCPTREEGIIYANNILDIMDYVLFCSMGKCKEEENRTHYYKYLGAFITTTFYCMYCFVLY